MSAQENGGPAFPHVEDFNPDGSIVPMSPGMTLRDYFAGKVLNAHDMYYGNAYSMQRDDHRALLARDCYAMADAMLAERSKP